MNVFTVGGIITQRESIQNDLKPWLFDCISLVENKDKLNGQRTESFNITSATVWMMLF